MNHPWLRNAGLVTTGLALSCALILITSSDPILADVPWPTPPPGPQAAAPNVIATGIVPAQVPAVPGSTLWVIPPLAMPVPRFPPVPSSSFDAPDGVRITSDAGSIITTVQLTYEPVQIDKARPAVPGQELRKAFTLRAFDHEAGSIRLDLRRPLVLEIPVRDLTRSFETPDRLLIARYHDSAGWVPLVTHYHRSLGVLRARVLELGQFAVLAETQFG